MNIENDSKLFNKHNIKVKDVCWCECHREGTNVLHVMPCCSLGSEKYLSVDGKLLLDKYVSFMEVKSNE